MDLKKSIRNIPDFPKKGIQFKDVTSLLKDAKAFHYSIEQFAEKYKDKNITAICGVESRGFIIGAALAFKMKLPFIPVRKKGKLPAETISVEYQLEYGTDTLEIHKDALNESDSVIIIDDLMATGGTMFAAAELVEKLGAKISEISVIVDLPDLGGSKKIKEKYNFLSLVDYEGH
ncbi:MAG: adenine phosphoribosyltransferase [Bdellovibrionota bacterium]|nr:adenine phosphoribosyltransferase [Bdellovibrionota bacterium]